LLPASWFPIEGNHIRGHRHLRQWVFDPALS
jgi:hypothetical protein